MPQHMPGAPIVQRSDSDSQTVAWALVGDAGMHKEYVSGDGMSEALVQAKRLAAAIAEDSEAALQRYWHERDAYALPRFCFYKDQGAAGPRAPSRRSCSRGLCWSRSVTGAPLPGRSGRILLLKHLLDQCDVLLELPDLRVTGLGVASTASRERG
jgi:hypothetical protein